MYEREDGRILLGVLIGMLVLALGTQILFGRGRDINGFATIDSNVSPILSGNHEALRIEGGRALININKADADMLSSLSGIGPALSERILEYRALHGDFSSLDQLKEVNGIGEKLFDRIKDDICLS